MLIKMMQRQMHVADLPARERDKESCAYERCLPQRVHTRDDVTRRRMRVKRFAAMIMMMRAPGSAYMRYDSSAARVPDGLRL